MSKALLIKYHSKDIQQINTPNVEATVINYGVEKESLEMMATMQPEEYTVQYFGLYSDDSNIIDLVVDNIPGGHLIQGGMTDNKYFLTAYLVKKGIDEVLQQLMF